MKKRAEKLAAQEAEVTRVLEVLQSVEQMSHDEGIPVIVSEGFRDVESFRINVNGLVAQLRADKGESPEDGDEDAIRLMQEKSKEVFIDYDLLATPNDELSARDLKEKRRMRLLKTQQEMRQRAAVEKEKAEARRKQEEQEEEEKRSADPEKYRRELLQKYEAMVDKVRQRRLRAQEEKTKVVVGTGSRLGREARERMRLVAAAAFNGGKMNGKMREDTFGANDKDWEVYKKMRVGNDDEELDEAKLEEEEIGKLATRLKGIDADFVPTDLDAEQREAEEQQELCDEDFQLEMCVEKFSTPELLFQPCIKGIDEGGLHEALFSSLRKLPEDVARAVADGGVYLTGGCAQIDGLKERLEKELIAARPVDEAISVVRVAQPATIAWAGASQLAKKRLGGSPNVSHPHLQGIGVFTRQQYEAHGVEYLKMHLDEFQA